MTVENCTKFGTEPTRIYGYAARRIRKGLEVTLCLPDISRPVEFDIDAKHERGQSKTHLGYQLNQASREVVIFTDTSMIPSALQRSLSEACTLIDYNQVEFEMCVGSSEVMLPNAEYDGKRIRRIDPGCVNRCDHEYEDSLSFLQLELDYPSP